MRQQPVRMYQIANNNSDVTHSTTNTVTRSDCEDYTLDLTSDLQEINLS